MVKIGDLCERLGLDSKGRLSDISPAGSGHQTPRSSQSKGQTTSILEEARTYVRQYKTSKGTRGVDLPSVSLPNQPGIFEMTLEFLETGRGKRFWPSSHVPPLPGELRWPKDSTE